MDKKNQTICAIVVTYNRKELLLECLQAILRQSYPIQVLYVIDNASIDGTPYFLEKNNYIASVPNVVAGPVEIKKTVRMLSESNQDKEVMVSYVRMPLNTGGAGGFYEGIKRAYTNGYQWLWIMDDDTVPENDTLYQLLGAYETIDEKNEAGILASKVLWTDGKEHSMNAPSFNFRANNFSKYSERGILPIKSATFVSILVKNECVEKFGLPIKEYFIWNDDAEYTSRILKGTKGFFVDKSIVIHKTKSNYISWESIGDKYYYEVRNKLWSIRSSSYYFYEKIRIIVELLDNTRNYLAKNGLGGLRVVIRGLISGLFYRLHHD